MRLQMVRVDIENTYGPRYVPDKPNFYKSGKSAQEAHEAIRPTDLTNTPQRSPAVPRSPDQFRLYSLIYQSLRCRPDDAGPRCGDQRRIRRAVPSGLFKAKGARSKKFDGYRKVLPPGGKQEDVTLPSLTRGAALSTSWA